MRTPLEQNLRNRAADALREYRRLKRSTDTVEIFQSGIKYGVYVAYQSAAEQLANDGVHVVRESAYDRNLHGDRVFIRPEQPSAHDEQAELVSEGRFHPNKRVNPHE